VRLQAGKMLDWAQGPHQIQRGEGNWGRRSSEDFLRRVERALKPVARKGLPAASEKKGGTNHRFLGGHALVPIYGSVRLDTRSFVPDNSGKKDLRRVRSPGAHSESLLTSVTSVLDLDGNRLGRGLPRSGC